MHIDMHDKYNVYTYKYIAKIKAIFILIIQAIIKWQSAECVLALNKDKLSGMCFDYRLQQWLQNNFNYKTKAYNILG